MTGERFLCTHCLAALPRSGFWHHQPDNTTSFVRYRSKGLTGRIVKTFKYQGKKELARYCGQLMAQELDCSLFEGIDAIIPVPLSKGRGLWRGYNQSEWLAKGISMVTGIPVCTNLLRRHSFNGSQTRLNIFDRIENVYGTFYVNKREEPKYAGKHIILIDDVITWGATTGACQEALAVIPGLKIKVLGFASTK